MFFARTTPPDVAPDALRAVRVAINTPVVSTGELPVGPARAALAVHVLASGQPDVTVAVRSLRDDALALYGFEGSFSSEGAVSVALDAALSFAEAMGFLFDEDLIGEDADASARHAAWLRWREIAEGATPLELDADPESEADPDGATPLELEAEPLGEIPAEPEAAAAPAPAERAAPDDALLLEDLAEELELEPRGPAPPSLEPTAAPAPALTKFRTGAAPEASEAAKREAPGRARPPLRDEEPSGSTAARGAALGRLPLVKRRRGARKALDPLLRLLGSF